MNAKSKCRQCFWLGLSCSLAIGGAIAATGDYALAQSQVVPDGTLGGEKLFSSSF